MSDPLVWKARELEILRLLAEGLTDAEIGARLHLASETIRWYNKRIYQKLGVNNRTQAVSWASAHGLLDPSALPSLETPRHPVKSPIQYVANGDVHIAYLIMGDGPIDLLIINGFLSHLEMVWEDPRVTGFFEQLGSVARVILFDKRGVGLSDRIQGAPTLENTVDDALCVLEAVGSKRPFIMGISEGGAAAALLASTYPDRAHGLIFYAACPKFVRTDDEPEWAMPEATYNHAIDLMRQTWGQPYAIDLFAPSLAHDEHFRAWWARLLRASSSPSSITAIFDNLRQVDIRPILPYIHTRTLVIHRTGDQVIRVGAGRYIAEHLPNATWLELPGADHLYFFAYTPVIEAIEQFFKHFTAGDSADTALATILYMISDQKTMPADDIQTAVNAYHGRYMTDVPRGMMALFDGPTRAVRCALRLREVMKPAHVRIGLHVGECHVIKGQPGGTLVQVASQVVRYAAPGDILITRPLRDILAGSGLRFEVREDFLIDQLPVYAAQLDFAHLNSKFSAEGK